VAGVTGVHVLEAAVAADQLPPAELTTAHAPAAAPVAPHWFELLGVARQIGRFHNSNSIRSLTLP